MSHITVKYPLEKMQSLVLMRLQLITAFVLVMQTRTIRAWAIMIGAEKTHHGGGLLIAGDDSLRVQSRMARLLGSLDRAAILQKMHEWSEFNKSEGRTATTYNAYAEWIEDHFGWMNTDSLGRHIRDLETMGLLVTQRVGRTRGKAYDQRKTYRIDYGKLNVLLRQGAKMPSASKNPADANVKSGNSKMKKGAASLNTADSNLNLDSNSSTQFSTNVLPNQATQETTQEKPTNQGHGGRRAGAGRKPKAKEALTETTPVTASASEAVPVEASMGTADAPDNPSPRSEAPSPHAEADLIERMIRTGIEDDKAAALIDEYGANRVRAVVQECDRRLRLDKVHSPAGWIIRELENDVFKLGEVEARVYFNAWIEPVDDDSDSPTLTPEVQDEIVVDAEVYEPADETLPAPDLPLVEVAADVVESPVERPAKTDLSQAQDRWANVLSRLPHGDEGVDWHALTVVRGGVTVTGYDAEAGTYFVTWANDAAKKALSSCAEAIARQLCRDERRMCTVKRARGETPIECEVQA